MGFGFVVVKFALFIEEVFLVLTNKQAVVPGKGYSNEIGILLVAIGAFMDFYAYWRYHITEKQL